MTTSGIIETGLSDRNMVFTVLTIKLPRPKAVTVAIRSLKKFDSDAFKEDLDKVPFSTAYIFDNIDGIYWMW